MDKMPEPDSAPTDRSTLAGGEADRGLSNLVSYYKSLFAIAENRNHYSSADYFKAQRKFVKFQLQERLL